MTIEEIVSEVLRGDLDNDLDTLAETVKARRAALTQQKFLLVKNGATGTLTNLRPKYLVGAPVTVIGRKQKRLEVEIDASWDTGRYPKKVTVSPDMIELD